MLCSCSHVVTSDHSPPTNSATNHVEPQQLVTPIKIFRDIVIMVVIIVIPVPFFVCRNVLVHHRVLEGGDCKADIITGDDSTANGAAKYLANGYFNLVLPCVRPLDISILAILFWCFPSKRAGFVFVYFWAPRN